MTSFCPSTSVGLRFPHGPQEPHMAHGLRPPPQNGRRRFFYFRQSRTWLEQLRSKTGRDIVKRPDSRRTFRCVLSFVLFVFSLFLVCCLVLLIVFCCVVALFVVTFDLGKSPLVQKRNQNPPKPERNPQASIKNVGYKRKRI